MRGTISMTLVNAAPPAYGRVSARYILIAASASFTGKRVPELAKIVSRNGRLLHVALCLAKLS